MNELINAGKNNREYVSGNRQNIENVLSAA